MKRLLMPAIAMTALALSACGSDGTASRASSPSNAAGAAGAAATVSIAAVDGVGDVLVDPSGKALYTPDEEASGTVLCLDECVSIWVPLAAGADRPTSPEGGPTLGVITRPDGTKQVTTGGHPLYTFAMDAAGQVTGDGVADAFGSQHFTWHVVMSDGTVASTPGVTTPTSPGGGYGY